MSRSPLVRSFDTPLSTPLLFRGEHLVCREAIRTQISEPPAPICYSALRPVRPATVPRDTERVPKHPTPSRRRRRRRPDAHRRPATPLHAGRVAGPSAARDGPPWRARIIAPSALAAVRRDGLAARAPTVGPGRLGRRQRVQVARNARRAAPRRKCDSQLEQSCSSAVAAAAR